MANENHPDGFLLHPRTGIGKRDPQSRVQDYREIFAPEYDRGELSRQGQRCMDCGIPTCMSGCPIGNIIPDWNDLVSRDQWREALARLHATNNFPEFTGYTCPAPCEDACVLAINDKAVTIKDIERSIVDTGWENGWIQPLPPTRSTGKRVAIVGSGPAGLSAAQQLARVGHAVTVFERDDEIGGLMAYGIPDFKFEKHRVQRRREQMEAEGVFFQTNFTVGVDRSLENLRNEFDAVALCIGAQKPREVPIPGRDLRGIYHAMAFLSRENRRQAGKAVSKEMDAYGKDVIVLGGGDTGADCVATAQRQGARQVVQISINKKPPETRPDSNPWPKYEKTYRRTYAQEEGGQEEFAIDTVAFLDTSNNGWVNQLQVERVEWSYDQNGRRQAKQILEPDIRIPADLVLLAIGFAGAQSEDLNNPMLALRPNGTIVVDDRMMTNLPGVFAAGDAQMGQSLVVWAIGEGRDLARQIDLYLMHESRLPASLRTQNPPLPFRQ